MKRAVVNFGGGTNSGAVCVGLYERGERPDFIVFADTGGELPRTYAFLDTMDAWLASVGFPTIVRVRGSRGLAAVAKGTREVAFLTLEQQCLETATMPGAVYGMSNPSESPFARCFGT